MTLVNVEKELSSFFDSFSSSLNTSIKREQRKERMERLLDILKHPEESFNTYHVAGSKGKGSVSFFLSSLLDGGERKSAVYSSPHMFSVKERFKRPFSYFDSSSYLETLDEIKARLRNFSFPENLGYNQPTTFELYTSYAYLLFKNNGVTDAVIETGIGGRLDATNTIKKKAAIITTVEKEHTDILGESIKKIAFEKAGIIYPKTPVFTSNDEREVLSVIIEEALKKESPVYSTKNSISNFTYDMGRASFILDEQKFSFNLKMRTKEMAENASLAVLTAEKLSLLEKKAVENIEKISLPGRFQEIIISALPVVIDSAHTPLSSLSTLNAFSQLYEGGTLLFSLIEGKNTDEIIKILFPHFRNIIITEIKGFKKSNAVKIYQRAKSFFPYKSVRYMESADEAFSFSLSLSAPILITGSFYLAPCISRIRDEI